MSSLAKLLAERSDYILSVEERSVVSVAYKNSISQRRAAWRVVSSIEEKEKSRSHKGHLLATTRVRERIEQEMQTICSEALQLLEKLLENAQDTEAKVFYGKLKGDYFRYLAEFSVEGDRAEVQKGATDAYKSSLDLAELRMEPMHPVRLGLALNFAVFQYEILNKTKSACELAKSAFDAAINGLETLSEDLYHDSTLLLQLLRDNLTNWARDQAEMKIIS